MASLALSRKRPRSANETPLPPQRISHKRMRGGQTSYGPSKPSFKGEKHVYLKVPGGIARANYAGPGTDVKARLARGDLPINAVDAISKAHDLRYMIANNYDAVRAADSKMIAALNALPAGADSAFNIAAAKKALQLKLAAEDKGLVKRGRIAQHATGQTPEEIAAYNAALAPLAQQGYGSKKKKKKGRFVKGSVEAKERMAALRAMKGKGLKIAGDGLKIAGDGLTVAGNGKAPVYTPKLKQITNYGGTEEFVRKVLSKALMVAAAYIKDDDEKDSEALLGEGFALAGNGMVGGSAFKKIWKKVKQGAQTLWKKVQEDPVGSFNKAKAYAKKYVPKVVSAVKEITGKGAAFERASQMEGYGARLAQDLCECCHESMQQGNGLADIANKAASEVKKRVLSAVNMEEVESEAKKIAADPALLTNKEYLSSVASRVSNAGIKKLNEFLKSHGVNASIAIPRRLKRS